MDQSKEKDTGMNSNLIKKTYFWNTLSGMLNAGQSALILFFIMHFSDATAGGIFSISFSFANLFYTMAKYGTRNFQVTDIDEKYSFREYLTARILTTGLMVIISFLYIGYRHLSGQYELEKTATILLICMWKYIDSMEDVVYGMYQQKGRMDIGSKNYSLRIIFSTVLFCLLIVLKVRLIWVAAIVLGSSIIVSFFMISRSITQFEVSSPSFGWKNIMYLLKACFPLFIGYALSVYFGNLPKYLIDSYLPDSNQAYFNIIMMPAFVIQVLSQFIYQPIVNKLGILWVNNDTDKFKFYVTRQYLILAGLTVLLLLGGSLLGIPLLSFVFNADLSGFYWEFLVLLVGGGIYAICSFSIVPLTTIRAQGYVAIGFLIVSAIGFLAGGPIVKKFGIMGASMLYTILNIILACYLITVLFISIKRNNTDKQKDTF